MKYLLCLRLSIVLRCAVALALGAASAQAQNVPALFPVTGPTEVVHIWVGTITDPPGRPALYGDETQSLQASEEASSAVHHYTWSPGSQPVGVQKVAFNPPNTGHRGAHGVTGLLVADILPNAGDELVVATMSGDLIILSADNLNEIVRTHVDGAIGFYNGMEAADLNADGHTELYVAGSIGLWRFISPLETGL